MRLLDAMTIIVDSGRISAPCRVHIWAHRKFCPTSSHFPIIIVALRHSIIPFSFFSVILTRIVIFSLHIEKLDEQGHEQKLHHLNIKFDFYWDSEDGFQRLQLFTPNSNAMNAIFMLCFYLIPCAFRSSLRGFI